MAERQSGRYKARQVVTQAVNQLQRERIERDRRHVGLVVTLLDSLAKRNVAIDKHEAAAAGALRELVAEGVSLADVVALSGEQVTVKELQRLTNRTDNGGGDR